MNDETRKLLTEFLVGKIDYKFSKRNGLIRTFTTPDDMMALKDRLVEKGEWEDFYLWAALKEDAPIKEPNYVDWLLNAPRFCELVGEFIMSTKSENAEII